MKINCIITDDEPIAQEIIENYVKLLPELNLVSKCGNAIETFTALRQNEVDILFLDIQMPEINGLDLIRSLQKVPLLVFTTAYPSFAIDGFNLDAVDYLLKPISLERFLKAMEKVFFRLSRIKQLPLIDSPHLVRNFFFIKSDCGLIRIDFADILYIEGLENYIRIICENKTVVSLYTMKAIESVLPKESFLRIHRSYIVNMYKVESVRDFQFKVKSNVLQVGKSYKKSVQTILKLRYSIDSE